MTRSLVSESLVAVASATQDSCLLHSICVSYFIKSIAHRTVSRPAWTGLHWTKLDSTESGMGPRLLFPRVEDAKAGLNSPTWAKTRREGSEAGLAAPTFTLTRRCRCQTGHSYSAQIRQGGGRPYFFYTRAYYGSDQQMADLAV